MRTGAEQIAEERATHTTREGYNPEHDDQHTAGEIAFAAACFAAPRQIYTMHETKRGVVMHDPFPWGRVVCHGRSVEDTDGWHMFTTAERKEGKSRVRQLVIAGALIAAEIDRLQRAYCKHGTLIGHCPECAPVDWKQVEQNEKEQRTRPAGKTNGTY
jgi:hypothetical protein